MTEFEDLIKRCVNKDPKAEYALYKQCFQMLMRICCRYTHNDDDSKALLNKGFLKIIINLNKYDTKQPFDKWAKTIMVNTIIDEFRVNKNKNTLMKPYTMEEIPQNYHPIDINIAEQKLSADDIIEQIKKLPEPSKEVFNLFVFDGLSHKEISAALNMAEGTSRWHLANARALLKKQLSSLFSTIKLLVL